MDSPGYYARNEENMYNTDEVAKRVKKLRKKTGMSQEKFAEVIGVSRESVARYETGKRSMTIDVIDLYVSYCKVSADYILYGTRKCESVCNQECGETLEMLNNVPEEMQKMVYGMIKGMLEKITE